MCVVARRLLHGAKRPESASTGIGCGNSAGRTAAHNIVVNTANRVLAKVDFGIGRSLHQCVPLSVRACQAIVSMLSSECYLT